MCLLRNRDKEISNIRVDTNLFVKQEVESHLNILQHVETHIATLTGLKQERTTGYFLI